MCVKFYDDYDIVYKIYGCYFMKQDDRNMYKYYEQWILVNFLFYEQAFSKNFTWYVVYNVYVSV